MKSTWTVVIGLIAACGSRTEQAQTKGSGDAVVRVAGPKVPQVGAGVTVDAPAFPPPVIILLDERGGYRINVAATWDELSTKDLLAGAVRTDGKRMQRLIHMDHDMGRSAQETYDAFKLPDEPPLIDDIPTPPPTSDIDDPPPPEEEDMGDTTSGRDEGTVRGEYKVVSAHRDDTQWADDMLKAEHDKAKKRATLFAAAGPRLVDSRPPRHGKVLPQHQVVAEVVGDGKFERPHALVLAPATAKANLLVDMLAATPALIAASHDGKIRPLRLELAPETTSLLQPPKRWIELHLGARTAAFEAVPEAPVIVEDVRDQAGFAAALDRARKVRNLDPRSRVDVLVDPDVDVQRLVDVTSALDRAGVVMIGLGRAPAPGSDAAKLRGTRHVDLDFGRVDSSGLDRPAVRAKLDERGDAIVACYAQAGKPKLAGTVTANLAIGPDGKVTSSTAEGMDPHVASCIASALGTLVFAPPQGDRSNVTYPITFEP